MTQEENFFVAKDGHFTLDPGAYFGITPRNVWSKYFPVNEQYRVELRTNIPVIEENGKVYLMDGGLGSKPDENTVKWFQCRKDEDLLIELKSRGIENIHGIFQTHLHFDHMGHTFRDFKDAPIYVANSEIGNMKYPNELSRGSYLPWDVSYHSANIRPLFGNTEIGNFSVIRTSGHTTGHQAIIYRHHSTGILYAGDIFPSSFHLKPSRITAIDSMPLSTLKIKKDLLRKAIAEKLLVIFSHDTQHSGAFIGGDPSDPKILEFYD